MLGYYKKQILALKISLNALQKTPDNLALLKDLQISLVQKILRTERKIKKHKLIISELKGKLKDRLAKEEAKKLKEKIQFNKKRMRDLKWLLHIWRTFGDGIAYTYLSKWDLKPLLYNEDNPDVKQRAGHLSGKDGFITEILVLFDALKANVPALLTDLTNSIRYGDICLMGNSVPHLLEVKSSANKTTRTERQSKNLKNVQSYLDTDEGENVRGFPHTSKRLDILTPEVNYAQVLNKLIGEALENGHFALAKPESGITYLAITGTGALPKFAECVDGDPKECIFFFLNEAKNKSAWMCYYPFTLAIERPEDLYAFLEGHIYLLVVLWTGQIRKMALENGLEFNVLADPEWAWEYKQNNTSSSHPIHFKVSHHFVDRMAYEFISLKWAFQTHLDQMKYMMDNIDTLKKAELPI